VAGPQYPTTIDWPANVERIEHLPPAEHPQFYSSSRFTLNVTRADMIAAGWSPSVRLFEAAACATPIISDSWPGIEDILEHGSEILLADTAMDILAKLSLPGEGIGAAARKAVLRRHSAARRAEQFEACLTDVMSARRAEIPIDDRRAVA
jgi:spore maturation protein CgeB